MTASGILIGQQLLVGHPLEFGVKGENAFMRALDPRLRAIAASETMK
jgi:hypothetical protein